MGKDKEITFTDLIADYYFKKHDIPKFKTVENMNEITNIINFHLVKDYTIKISKLAELKKIKPIRKKDTSKNSERVVPLENVSEFALSTTGHKTAKELVKSSVHFKHYMNIAIGYQLEFVTNNVQSFLDACENVIPPVTVIILCDDKIEAFKELLNEMYNKRNWSPTRLRSVEYKIFKDQKNKDFELTEENINTNKKEIIFMTKQEFENCKENEVIIKR